MNPNLGTLRAWATIHLSALERNLTSIRNALPAHLQFVSVVKANAYGHGMAPVVTRLMRASTDAFAVANLSEARQLANVGSGWPILILSTLLPDEFNEAARLPVIPVLSSIAELDLWAAAARRVRKRLPFHLKIDSGMGRLGVWHTRAKALHAHVQSLPALQLTGLCTHFAAADAQPAFTRLQRQRFLRAIKPFLATAHDANLMLHADNSAGLESFPANGTFNAARVGLLQFGIRPHPSSLLADVPVCPTLSLHARVGLVKSLPANAPVSYGLTYRTRKPARIAVLTAGYADGIPIALSNCGHVEIHGQLCPIIGRITMDQTIVDVSALPATPTPGTVVTVIDHRPQHPLALTRIATLTQRIPWELLTALSPRCQRIYSTDSAG